MDHFSRFISAPYLLVQVQNKFVKQLTNVGPLVIDSIALASEELSKILF